MPTRHTIAVAPDERLVAVHHAPGAPTEEPWVVYCHGFVSDKSGSYEGRCRRAVEAGYHAVRFDFRGCGESGGAFVDQTLSAKIADLEAVLDHFDAPSYVLFGSSFGAKTAFHTAVDDDRIAAVAGRAPLTYNRAFDELRAAVEREGEFTYETGETVDRRFFEDFATYSFEEVTAALDVPVAIFHGAADESVPLVDSLDATGAFDVDVLVQVFGDEGHRFSPAAETRLRRQLFEWLASL